MSTKIELIYQALVEAAKQGSDCPTNADLEIVANCPRNSVSAHLSQLEKTGKIRRRSNKSGRSIHIPEIGKTIYRKLSRNIVPQKFDDPDGEVIGAAKIVIRNAGFMCFRASVIGGPKDKWVVGRENNLMTEQQLLDYAGELQARKAAA